MLNPRYHQKPQCTRMIAVDWADCYLECKDPKFNFYKKCEHYNKEKGECGFEIKYEQCEGKLGYQDYGYWICDSCGSMLDERVDPIFPEDML
jgi:hypothetical protein